jgi:phage terminase Nu1 subunit (DNA packaging protein)
MKTVLNKKELSERWGVDPRTIDKFEEEGIIRRNKIGKFTIASIEKAEYDGTDALIMKKDREIRELKEQLLEYRTVIEKIKGAISI